MSRFFQTSYLRFLAAILTIAVPVSAFPETRPSARTDMARLAADLARVFGSDAVSIERSGSTARGGAPLDTSEEEPVASIAGTDVRVALVAMNRERARQGLQPLTLSADLSNAASMKAEDMHRRGYFDHVGPDGRRPADFARAAGYRYSMLGENLASGYRSGDTVVGAWMRSPGHRANILGAYSEVGIASLGGSPVRGYSGDTWVAIYGRQ